MEDRKYTTQLQAGLGLVSETQVLLDLWSVGMSATELTTLALRSGRFPNVTARRLRNIVMECFAPRYLVCSGGPAKNLKRLMGERSSKELSQFMLLFTSRANPILGDFIRSVYWPRYAGGYQKVSTDDARQFVERAIDDGRTAKRWSPSTVKRVSAYLVGCCADYGLLERGRKSHRQIEPFRIASATAAYLAYELHFQNVGDNALLTHDDWKLYGLAREDVVEELKTLSLKGLLIVQAAGDLIRISWKHETMDGLLNVVAQS